MSGPPLRIFQWRGQLRKGTSVRKGKVEIGGGVWVSGENFGISELPRLDFLQFQHDFRSFSDKKGLSLGGQNPSAGGGGATQGLGGALPPPPLQYIC